MEQTTFALLFTFIIGLFLLLGSFIVFVVKNNDKFILFSISIAFGVMVSLGFIELLPEAYEQMKEVFPFGPNLIAVVVFMALGFCLLRVLDYLIPNHDEHHHKHLGSHQMLHIGIVSSVALILHNIIEGMTIYGTVVTDLKMGFFISIGVALHNIPLGMAIASTFYKANNNKKKTLMISLGVSLSTLLGGIMMCLLKETLNHPMVIGVLLSMTLGMLIYIVLAELLPQIRYTKDKKTALLGIVSGILLLLISLIFE